MKEHLETVELLARDLRDGKESPRSPRETLAGYVLAARALDKCAPTSSDGKANTTRIVRSIRHG
jgi:hypothetical protein